MEILIYKKFQTVEIGVQSPQKVYETINWGKVIAFNLPCETSEY